MHNRSNLLIFTDLDGTLLDYHTYSKDAALPALNKLQKLGIPLIIVSSKTRAEIEPMLDIPSMAQTFITENGSAVFFSQDLDLNLEHETTRIGQYNVVILGQPYERVLEGIVRAQRKSGIEVRGFSSMTSQEISDITGLDIESARRAKMREFSEPFVYEGAPAKLTQFIGHLEMDGLTCTSGGRFFHVLGRCDKGAAVKKVADVYTRTYPEAGWKTVALGDSANDIPMLEAADCAVVISRHDGSALDYRPGGHQDVIRPSRIGPAGWNEAVLQLTDKDSANP